MGWPFGIYSNGDFGDAFVTCELDGIIRRIFPDGSPSLHYFHSTTQTGSIITVQLPRKLTRPTGIILGSSEDFLIVVESSSHQVVRIVPQ